MSTHKAQRKDRQQEKNESDKSEVPNPAHQEIELA